MWPRDSFAEQSLSMGVRGRFSTLGYDAKVLDDGEPKTIQSTAESILSYIRADRPPVSRNERYSDLCTTLTSDLGMYATYIPCLP
jgi:hypothetical protein